MPPRYAYWTILAGGLPTAFRAASREDLLPTLKRLAATHPDAELKWFARGRLWSSPEAARAEPRATPARRGQDWRPGGEHRDPRQAHRDAKKTRNQARRQHRFRSKEQQGSSGAAGPPRQRSGSPAGPKPRRTPGRPAPGTARAPRGRKGGRRS